MTDPIYTGTFSNSKAEEFSIEEMEKSIAEIMSRKEVPDQPLYLRPTYLVLDPSFEAHDEQAVKIAYRGVEVFFMKPGSMTEKLGLKAVYFAGRIFVDEMARWWFYVQLKKIKRILEEE